MKRSSMIASALVVVFFAGARGLAQDWSLAWSDEFDGTSIDRTNWNFDIGGGGWGNEELEYYTSRSENARVEGGCLVIEARKERYRGNKYTSARLKTEGLRTFTYGKLEARMQIPYGQGMWPAFWILGTNIATVGWPNCGEVDIMENIGREPTIVHGALHGPGYTGAGSVGGYLDMAPAIVSQAFHTFAIEWDPGTIIWTVDGAPYMTKTSADVPGIWIFDDHPFFIILNVAVGGVWPGSPDASTVFPQKLLVDYVRVYSRTAPPPPPPPPPPGTRRLHVEAVTVGKMKTGSVWQGMATVWVADETGAPVEGVTVSCQWSGLVDGGTTSAATDATGTAGPIYSAKTRSSGTIYFTVTGLTKTGYTYDPAANVVSGGQVTG